MKQMFLSIRGTLAFACLCLCFFTVPSIAQQQLHGHVPPNIAKWGLKPTGRLDGTKELTLTIGMPLRNKASLEQLIEELYDRTSPNFHQYLKPEQFSSQFGASEEDYQAVVAYAKANGMNVTKQYQDRSLLEVKGRVSDIEKALNVTLNEYKHPTENRIFYAPDREPSLALATPVLHIDGLETYYKSHPRAKMGKASKTFSGTGADHKDRTLARTSRKRMLLV